MVINFLKKLRSELLEEKMTLEAQQNDVQKRLTEKVIYLQRLKSEEEKSFNAFSPRKQNVKLRTSINQLEEERKKILDESEKLKQKFDHISSRLSVFDRVIEEAKRQKVELKKAVTIVEHSNNDKIIMDREFYHSFVQNFSDILHKTEFCLKLAEIDPIRCKFELSSVSKEMNRMNKLFSEIGVIEYEKTNNIDDR